MIQPGSRRRDHLGVGLGTAGEGPGGDLGRDAHRRLAKLGVETGQEGLAQDEEGRQVDVVRQRHVVLHLVKPRAVHDPGGVLLPVDHTLVERGMDLAEAERRGVGAERFEHLHALAAGGRADLQALEVGRHHDGADVVGYLAKAVVPHGGQHHAGPLEPFAQHVARGAVREGLHRVAILEEVGQVEDGGGC